MEITVVIQQMADANVTFRVRKRGWGVKDLTILGEFDPETKKALAVIVSLVDSPILSKAERVINYNRVSDYPEADVNLADVLPIARKKIAEAAAYEGQSLAMGFSSAAERAEFEEKSFWKTHNL